MSNTSVRIIHSQSEVPVTDGANAEPLLITSTTSQYQKLWNDDATSAFTSVTIYRPMPANDFFIIGDYAQGDDSPPQGVSQTVKAVNDDPNNALLQAPASYRLLWTDGSAVPGSIWYAVPPDGYISIGCICDPNNPDQPSVPSYRCLRRDLVDVSQAGAVIWNSDGTGTVLEIALWQNAGVVNSFMAQGNFKNSFSGTPYKIKTTNG
jgi:hypothetical protein